MADLRCMIHGLVETARVELRKDLLLLDVDEDGRAVEGVADWLVIEWDKLEDNLVEIKLG